MSTFTNIESYKHKCAKEVFKKWCDSSSWGGDGKYIKTNYDSISWRSNRLQDAWLEYPIVVNDEINSIQYNWDEIYPGFTINDNREGNNFVPTYSECKEYNLQPIAVIDVVLPHKGSPAYFIEICHTNPVSNEKIEKLEKLGVKNLIEIDAEWILRQTNIPSTLQIKRWLI